MALDGMIFDLDGTLVDTNAAHIEAWRNTFERFGYRIAEDRIAVEVGKGGDMLVPAVLGRSADQKDGDALRKAQPEEFGKIAKARGLRPFPKSADLVKAVRKRGLKAALATSSNDKQLKLTEECSGVRWRELFDQVVGADDIETSKPAPDAVATAVKKLAVSPAQCAMVGDTPYDAESAKHAGVVCLGLTCGGRSAGDLLEAGARAVWKDAADLLAHLDDALRVASPGSAYLTEHVLEKLMRAALEVAREGMDAGEVPIGAVLARGDGSVIARGFNQLNRTRNKTAHAEIITFADSAGKVPDDARDLILVSTLEPCVMCLGAAMEAAVDTIVYGLKAPADSGTGRVNPPQSPESGMPRIVGGILPDESRKLFEHWLKKPGLNPQQIKFVKQLLALTEDER